MNRSTTVVVAGIFLCALSLVLLQQRFDASDHAKAERLLRHFRVEAGPETFEDFLVHKTQRRGTWATEITGGCRGVVRVRCLIDGNPPEVHEWDVEIPSQAIHPTPASPSGERLLREFTGQALPLPALRLPPPDAAPAKE